MSELFYYHLIHSLIENNLQEKLKKKLLVFKNE